MRLEAAIARRVLKPAASPLRLTTGLEIVYYILGLPLGAEPPQQSAEVSRDVRNGRRTVGQPVDSFPQLYQGCF